MRTNFLLFVIAFLITTSFTPSNTVQASLTWFKDSKSPGKGAKAEIKNVQTAVASTGAESGNANQASVTTYQQSDEAVSAQTWECIARGFCAKPESPNDSKAVGEVIYRDEAQGTMFFG